MQRGATADTAAVGAAEEEERHEERLVEACRRWSRRSCSISSLTCGWMRSIDHHH